MSGCTICFSDNASNPYTLPCSHTFCTDCIMIWFRAGHKECPLCRDPSTVRNSWIDATKRAQAIIKRARCKRASARLKKKVSTVQKRHNLYRLHCKMFAQRATGNGSCQACADSSAFRGSAAGPARGARSLSV